MCGRTSPNANDIPNNADNNAGENLPPAPLPSDPFAVSPSSATSEDLSSSHTGTSFLPEKGEDEYSLKATMTPPDVRSNAGTMTEFAAPAAVAVSPESSVSEVFSADNSKAKKTEFVTVPEHSVATTTPTRAPPPPATLMSEAAPVTTPVTTPVATTTATSLPSPVKRPLVETPPGREEEFQLRNVPVDECPVELTRLVAELRFAKTVQCPKTKANILLEGYHPTALYQRYESAEALRVAFEDKKERYQVTTDKRIKLCQEVYRECWLEPYLLQVGIMPRHSILLVDFSTMVNTEDLCNQDTTEGSHAFHLTGKPFDEARIGNGKFVKMNRGHFMYTELGYGYGARDVQAREATKHNNLHKVCPAIDSIQRVVGLLLKHYGKSEVVGEDGTTPYRCTLMHTLGDFFQSPHVDYSADDIATRKRKKVCVGSSVGEDAAVPMPWSADFPIKGGGLKLNFWYNYDQTFYGHTKGMEVPVKNRAITITVPLQYLILWRADMVHSGGLDDDLRMGATRIHMYLPSTEYQASGVHGRAGTIQTEPYSGFLYPRHQSHVGKERRYSYCGKRKRKRTKVLVGVVNNGGGQKRQKVEFIGNDGNIV